LCLQRQISKQMGCYNVHADARYNSQSQFSALSAITPSVGSGKWFRMNIIFHCFQSPSPKHNTNNVRISWSSSSIPSLSFAQSEVASRVRWLDTWKHSHKSHQHRFMRINDEKAVDRGASAKFVPRLRRECFFSSVCFVECLLKKRWKRLRKQLYADPMCKFSQRQNYLSTILSKILFKVWHGKAFIHCCN